MRTGTKTGLAVVIFAAAGAIAQTSAATVQTGAKLVTVDVVVQDKADNPIHGLKQSTFRLTDTSKLQTLENFEEHTTATPLARDITLPKLPPGTFTDYTPTPPTGALNIILFDALNTPMKDQSTFRYQFQQYVQNADPSMHIAVLGLATHLVLLQSFTSDPKTLKDAVEHKLIPRASVLLDGPTNGNTSNPLSNSSEMELAYTAANLSQFETEQAATQTQFRAQYTLDALHDLAHYLAAFPGRKNLVWFSGSFPVNILPDASVPNAFSAMQLNADEFRETSNMLARSQVAVYPVEVRSPATQPSPANERATMEQLATNTGGQAFDNINSFAEAVKQAFTTGTNFYTLTYAPTDGLQNGAFHRIHVEILSNNADTNIFQLSYRNGYYADDPKSRRNSGLDLATTPAETVSAAHMASAYATAAMERGTPAPEDILFKVRVLPASTKDEPTVAPDNSLDPMQPAKGPFRRFDVDFATLPNEFKFSPQADGRLTGKFEFIAHVYDVNGRLLNATGSAIELNLSKDEYKQFLQKPIRYHMEISVPVRSEAFLRLGIQDIPANHIGAVEIPIASVSRLSPPDYATAPVAAASPSTHPSPATVPSTVPH